MMELSVSLGILFAYIVGTFLNVFWLSVVCLIFPIIYAVIFLFMPESPTYLINKNREEEAIKSFKFLRGKNFDPTEEIQEIRKENNEKSSNTKSFVEAFTRKSSLKALFISLIVMILQQVCGATGIVFYAKKIFQSAKTELNDDLQTIIVGVAFTITTFLAILFIDRLGRRMLLLISGTGITLCHITLATFFYLQESSKENVEKIGWLPIMALTFFIIFYAFGLGPIPFVIVGEILPADIKGKAAAIVMISCELVIFLITKFFPVFVAAFGNGTNFMVFAGLTIMGTLLVFIFVSETKGKSLIEIQEMLEKNFRFCKF
jgi:hypothetical protein